MLSWRRSVCPPSHLHQPERELLIGSCLRKRRKKQRQWRVRGGKRGRGAGISGPGEGGLKSLRRSAAGGDGREQELGGQEEEEGSKRRGMTSVRGGAVVGEREDEGKATLAHYDYVM